MTRETSVVSSVESNQNLMQLACVGPVRAMRFRRDTDLTTVRSLAKAELEEIMKVWSVGPIISRRIKGSAQGWVAKVRAEREQLTREKRVAVVAGQDVFDSVRGEVKLGKLIDEALNVANVELDEETKIGYVTGDEMGGNEVAEWFGFKRATNPGLMREQFYTPWEDYARFLDPLRFVDDDWQEKHEVWDVEDIPAGRMPETRSLSSIPFDVNREDEVEWWMAPAERTNELVEWSDEVVIVLDGKYADSVRRSCEYSDTECTTVFKVKDAKAGTVGMWKPDPDVETFEPDEDEQVTGGRGTYDGADLETDDFWRQEAFDTDEARLNGKRNDISQADPGGKGVGKNENRWG